MTAPLALLTRADLQQAQETGKAPAPVARIVIDGWEQVLPEFAEDVDTVIVQLAAHPDLAIHVVVGARDDAADTDPHLAQAGGRLRVPHPRRPT